jgi:hypothetical protein
LIKSDNGEDDVMKAKKGSAVTGVFSLMALFLGCTVQVNDSEPPETKIRAKNDFVGLAVQAGGAKVNVSAVDLDGVTIGDVFFSRIKASTLTSEKTTSLSGNVSIDIDSIEVTTESKVLTVSAIDPMTTAITKHTTNTVIFNPATAGGLLAALSGYLLPETKIKARNDLTDLTVDVNGSVTDVDAIDLEEVTIGDVLFSSVPAGTTTSEKSTQQSGAVTISIERANVVVMLLGQSVTMPMDDIDAMVTNIDKGTVNTVEFNETTAGVIFSALAKRKAN